MTELITKNSKLSNLGLLISIPLLIIGGLIVTSSSPINWLILTIVGAISLIIQFGTATFKKLMKKPAKHSFWPIVISIVVAFVISIGSNFLGSMLGIKAVANSNVGNLKTLPMMMRILNISKISFSLIGEELFAAAIALPVLYYLSKKMSSKNAWILAALISSALFGLIHFRVYNWNLFQMFVAIGLGRLPFTWAWVKTDSLWGGIIAHVIYDLLIFVPTTLFLAV